MATETPTATTGAKPQPTLVPRIPPEGILRVYSNNVQMATTSFDVRIIFGQIGEVLEENKIVVDQAVQVTMTWLEAKILADFLQANIKAHEELNGAPIAVPKNLDKIIVPDFKLLPKRE